MPQSSYRPTILLPEPDDPTIAEYLNLPLSKNEAFDIRSDKVDLEGAADLLVNGSVDAVVVGATHSSKDVFLTAIHKIGASNKDASSFFVMEKAGQPTIYVADCAVNPDPDSDRLVRIAEQTVNNVKLLGDEPIVAFISYSTLGSAGGPSVEKVRQAVEQFRLKHPEVITYGEVQWDAATSETIYKKKTKSDGYIDGKQPNTFIFPNLDTGNAMYKALERPGGYTAIGPLTQGLDGDKDFHDLSRGVTPAALNRICITVAKMVNAKRAGS